MKTCRKCGVEKPVSEYSKASKSPDGLQYWCRDCSSAAARQWAIDHREARRESDSKYAKSDKCKARRKARREGPQRERILEQKRESWYRNHDSNIEKLRARQGDPEFLEKQRVRRERWRARDPRGVHRNNLKSFYRMTLDEWDAMVLAQEGRCAICERPMELVVDHCHESNRVRALLCSTCNTGLGHFKDDPAQLRAAALYIESHRSHCGA